MQAAIQIQEMPNTGIMLPGKHINSDMSKELRSEVIGDTLVTRKVSILNIPEEQEIDRKNFIFDFSKVSSISVFQKEALKSLLVKQNTNEVIANDEVGNSETTIYMYKGKKLVKLGKGDSSILERIVPIMKKHVFDEEIEIYRDYIIGEEVQKFECPDIGNMRMNL